MKKQKVSRVGQYIIVDTEISREESSRRRPLQERYLGRCGWAHRLKDAVTFFSKEDAEREWYVREHPQRYKVKRLVAPKRLGVWLRLEGMDELKLAALGKFLCERYAPGFSVDEINAVIESSDLKEIVK